MTCKRATCDTRKRATTEFVGCKRPVGHFYYDFSYPEKDACGGDQPKFLGANIEVLGPGDLDYKVITFVPWPTQSVELAATEDGNYAVRHAIVGPCTVGEPSEPSTEYVDLTPAGKPPKGSIRIPCNQ